MMKAVALVLAAAVVVEGRTVVMAGDSWADYRGLPNQEFPKVFKEKGDTREVKNIAVSGSTCEQWADPDRYLLNLTRAASDPAVEIIWMACGGNDAMAILPSCAGRANTTQADCIAEVADHITKHAKTMYEAVHAVNPTARIVSFGYDLMGFNGILCGRIPPLLLPDCGQDIFCHTSGFTAIQTTFQAISRTHANYDTVNLLGSLQAHTGVPGAAIGSPVLSQYSPQSMYDITCIHPTRVGYHTIFTNFYDLYFSKTKGGPSSGKAH